MCGCQSMFAIKRAKSFFIKHCLWLENSEESQSVHKQYKFIIRYGVSIQQNAIKMKFNLEEFM